jgi:hypothetical protein
VGIRQALNENRAVTAVVTGVLTLVALGVALRSGCSSGSGAATYGDGAQAFYTVDDGQHWFLDDATKIPPFQHDGKTAYRAMVYQCKTDSKEFVARLERYSDADRQRIESLTSNKSGGSGHGPDTTVVELPQILSRVEVKRPGDANWVMAAPATMEAYGKVMQPQCPGGAGHEVEPVIAQ